MSDDKDGWPDWLDKQRRDGYVSRDPETVADVANNLPWELESETELYRVCLQLINDLAEREMLPRDVWADVLDARETLAALDEAISDGRVKVEMDDGEE